MRRWVFVIALLYGLALLASLWPVALFSALVDYAVAGRPFPDAWEVTTDVWGALYRDHGFAPICWGWLVLMVLAQVALLALPARLASGRPVSKGPLGWTVGASAFAMGLLFLGYGLTLVELFRGTSGAWQAWLVLGLAAFQWGAWAMMFWRMGGSGGEGLVERLRRILFRGSVLELLVAVPSHVWVRHRRECCGGIYTGLGIAMGISVMLFSFGPGVLFLYAARCRKLSPETKRPGSPRGIPTPGP